MKKYDKIFTDNPFIDELLYFTKTLAVNAVIKDCDEADSNETIESLKAADLYIACREGKSRFDHFTYDYDFLYSTHLFDWSRLNAYAKNNNLILQDYEKITDPVKKELFLQKINKIIQLKTQEYINNYEETNDYYRTLMGLPPMEDLETPIVKGINPSFVYVTEDIVSSIPQLTDDSLPLHEMDNEDLTILYSHGIIDELIEEYPDKKYLKFMGDNAIDVYKARKAMPFQILYIPTVSNNELMDRWNTKYEQNRMYTMKTYYSEAYKLYSDYYNNFIMVFIIIQTMIDIISEVQEFIARRENF